MKVFEKIENFENKVNFVDENNIFVGFDLEQKCCEECKYFFVKQLPKKVDYIDTDVLMEKEKLELSEKQLDPYIFDISIMYYSSDNYSDYIYNQKKIENREGIKHIEIQCNYGNKYDIYMIFKLVNKNNNGDNIFLFLCDCNDGLSGHDVFFGRKEEVILSFEI